MSERLSDEQLAEWKRAHVGHGVSCPVLALTQEVRRLRDTDCYQYHLSALKKAEAAFQQAVVDSTQMRADLEKAEAERDRYREALEAIVELAGKPNLQIVRASLIARAALDQKDS